MAKRWCGSSARAHEDGGAERGRFGRFRKFLALAAFALAEAARAASGADAPAPEASAAPENAEFLSLPALDLELLADPSGKEPPPARVGDKIGFKLVNPPEPELRVGPPSGGEPPADQGWSLIDQGLPGASLTLMPIKPGNLAVPSLPVLDRAGKTVARTNPLRLEAQSAIRKEDPKPQEPEPLEPPVSLGIPWLAIALLGLLVLGLLAAGIYALIRWSRKKRPVLPPVPAAPPKPEHEVALAALAELEAAGLPLRGQNKKHYFRISEILKAYLGARFGFDALESTSSEIVRALEERRQLLERQLDQLESLFGLLDRVKFTDHVPEEGEPARVLEEVRRLVNETRRSGSPDAVR
ncbi:MAG: hypothetical protein NDJ89_01715 [Oligoflexia bacterium]|nr:hypothetical protein [Oligoflexia bacterium]